MIAAKQWYTIICGWSEMEVHYVESHDAETAVFKGQCRSWRTSYAADPQSMVHVNPREVVVAAVFLGKIDNLYPFTAEP